jgi:hypothetical protein
MADNEVKVSVFEHKLTSMCHQKKKTSGNIKKGGGGIRVEITSHSTPIAL